MEFQLGWGRLPDEPLVIVYDLLSNRDRFFMSLVCRNWSRVFQTASLWRECTLDIGGSYLTVEKSKETKSFQFAQRYGKHVKKLAISWRHNPILTYEYFSDIFSNFMQLFSSANLTEFHLPKAEFNRFWDNDYNQTKVVNTMCNFFQNQKSLKVLDLNTSMLSMKNGCKVLRVMGQSSGAFIETLFMQDLFFRRIYIFLSPSFARIMETFVSLKILSTNYCYLSERIIGKWTVELAGKLRYLSIKVHREEPHKHKIPKSTWTLLRKACPDLRVKIIFTNIECNEMMSILDSHIPLYGIEFLCRYNMHFGNDITNILFYISDVYSRTLEDLSLELYNFHEMIDDALIFLLNECKVLKKLDISAILMVPTIDAICQMRKEEKIKLSFFHVLAYGLRQDEWQFLCYVKEKHESMFQELDLDFQFFADSIDS